MRLATGWPVWILAFALIATGLTTSSVTFASPLDNGPLNFEERVECQRAVEEVYWRHRLWPAANPGLKPPLEEVLPDAVLRERATSHLQKSAALEILWQRPLTGEQLQAELDRMARDTRQPELLRELFRALDDDALVVAECLARPALVNRLTRNWYARDARFHGKLREQAEAALVSHVRAGTRMQDLGGKYRETEWRLAEEDRSAPESEARPEAGRSIELRAEERRDRIGRLAALFDIEFDVHGAEAGSALQERIPAGSLSPLIEKNDRFVVAAVLTADSDSVRTATVAWDKRPFDDWWEQDGVTTVASAGSVRTVLPPDGGYRLPSPSAGACDLDTWGGDDIPWETSGHTAVWTGTEMIVWGGLSPGGVQNKGWRYFPATDSWKATSTGPGVPAARRFHKAVWTGTEMIVWGGEHGSDEYADTGGRYDPATNTWSSTSMNEGAPEPRSEHTAVWTGSEMIVWGGWFSGGSWNSGGRYDPATDSWTETSTGAGVPVRTSGHAAVWTGTEMIVWGGRYDNQNGGRYDPATDSWSPTSTGLGAPSGRHGHSAVWTGTEMIVWGGFRYAIASCPDTGGRYDPATDSWTPTSTATGVPSGRVGPAVWTGAELVVWGGDGNGGHHWSATGGKYDPVTDSWTPTPTDSATPAGRRSHTAVWTGTEMIVWGGVGPTQLNTGGRFDPATDSWTPTATEPGGPTARSGHVAAWTGSEMIVWGGYDADGYPATGGRLDAATNGWTPVVSGSGTPPGSAGQAAVWTGTEIIVWGGERYEGGFVYLNDGGRYNPTGDFWSATSTGSGVPAGRRYASAVWTGTEMIVWGGYDGSYLNTGGRYDPETDGWSATSTGTGVPTKRQSHTGIWTGNEMIVWGGYDGGTVLNTGGRYDPANDAWTPTSSASGVPVARKDHTAVWTGFEMIAWGGRDSNFLNSGGRYDPLADSWLGTSEPFDVPEERHTHTAIWTGSEMIVWGGSNYTDRWNYLTDGGKYDPATDDWTPTSLNYSHRAQHTAVWTGMEMILWGGYKGEHLRTLARYCTCGTDTVSTWYSDADGDGYGVDATAVPSCTQPPGYVGVGDDCDDTNAGTYSEAVEINDGLDNQCPGDDGHGLVDEISGVCGFHNSMDANEFSCPLQAGATRYEVARSPHPEFSSWVGCLRIVSDAATWVDTDPAPEGTCFYYLVRSHEPNMGSWGADSGRTERTVTCHR